MTKWRNAELWQEMTRAANLHENHAERRISTPLDDPHLEDFCSTSGLHMVFSADIWKEDDRIHLWFVTCSCLPVFRIIATFLCYFFAYDILAGTDLLRRKVAFVSIDPQYSSGKLPL